MEHVRGATTAQAALDAAARMACEMSGWSAALLSITVPSGFGIGAHGLTSDTIAHFRARARKASLAERRHNRQRLRERAFAGTSITYVSADASFHVRPTEVCPAGPDREWQPEDTVYILVPGSAADDIGVLSMDGPPGGRAPTAHRLNGLEPVQAFLERVGPILEARMLGEQLADRSRLLQEAQRLDVVGRVACEVAHDLNNLLTVICGTAEVAAATEGTPEDVVEHLERIVSVAQSASALSWRLLLAGRARAADHTTLDLGAVVAEQHLLLSRLFADGVPSLDLAVSPEPVWIRCDPGAITQIVLNLVVNARDAGPKSSVGISVDAFVEHGVHFARLRVTDDGPGMTEEVRSRLFAPFFTTKADGSGVGLATVRRIVDQHEGRILVESAPGRGATFEVHLPLADPP